MDLQEIIRSLAAKTLAVKELWATRMEDDVYHPSDELIKLSVALTKDQSSLAELIKAAYPEGIGERSAPGPYIPTDQLVFE